MFTVMTRLLLLMSCLSVVVQSWPKQGPETLLVNLIDSVKLEYEATIRIVVKLNVSDWNDLTVAFACGGKLWDYYPRVLQLHINKTIITGGSFKPGSNGSIDFFEEFPQQILFRSKDGADADYIKTPEVDMFIIVSKTRFVIFLDQDWYGFVPYNASDPDWGDPSTWSFIATGRPLSAVGYIGKVFPTGDTVQLDPNSKTWGYDQNQAYSVFGWAAGNKRLVFDFFPPEDAANPNKILMTFIHNWITDQVAVNDMDNKLTWIDETWYRPTYLKPTHYFNIIFYNTEDAIEVIISPQPGMKWLYRLIHRKDKSEMYGRFRWGSIYIGDVSMIDATEVKKSIAAIKASGKVLSLETNSEDQLHKKSDIEELEKASEQLDAELKQNSEDLPDSNFQ